MMDEIITKRQTGGWRGLGMTSRTRQLLASWYHESMNDATITALFWYQRNQLLFDQGLHRDKDCLLVDYAVLTNSPLETIRRICTFLDITYSSRMPALIRARSTVRVPPPPIEPDVREVCEELYERLVATSLVARGDSGGADAA